jgi:hypothetical protein
MEEGQGRNMILKIILLNIPIRHCSSFSFSPRGSKGRGPGPWGG